MQKKINLEFELHDGQLQVYNNANRFNTVNCGRRWGKTLLAECLLLETAIGLKKPVAYFGPNYKTLSEVWKYIKKELEDAGLVKNKSEQLKQIELVGGGLIDFWSLDDPNSGRGRKYARVVVDEVAMIKRFKEAWQQTIRPTLADFEGDCFMFSTPKGTSSYWYELCKNNKGEWKHFRMPTSSNPYISKAEIQAAKNELPPLVFAQEYEAKFVNFSAESWFFEFSREKHSGSINYEITEGEKVYLVFDFNHTPVSIIAATYDQHGDGIIIHNEHQIEGGTRKACRQIRHIYENNELKILGDASGNKKQSSAGNDTDFTIIAEELDLSRYNMKDTPKSNKLHSYSRGICNQSLYGIPTYINPRCKNLIEGIEMAAAGDDDQLIKDDSFWPSHLVDCKRYLNHGLFKSNEMLKKHIRNFKNIA